MIIKYNSNRASKYNRHQSATGRRAVLLIEMAFILPVLLLVMVLAIDVSRFLIVTMALNNSVNQGAVAGSNTALNLSSQTTWTNTIHSAISNSMANYNWFDPSKLNISAPVPSTSNGMIDSSGFRSIEVNVTYQADYVIPWQGYSSPGLVSMTLRTDQIR